MSEIFADANYWIALINPHDELHGRAMEFSELRRADRVVTTQMALVEVLNFYAEKGEILRQGAAQAIGRIIANSNTVVIS